MSRARKAPAIAIVLGLCLLIVQGTSASAHTSPVTKARSETATSTADVTTSGRMTPKQYEALKAGFNASQNFKSLNRISQTTLAGSDAGTLRSVPCGPPKAGPQVNPQVNWRCFSNCIRSKWQSVPGIVKTVCGGVCVACLSGAIPACIPCSVCWGGLEIGGGGVLGYCTGHCLR